MPRSLSSDFRSELESSRSGEILVIFATITHKDLLVPIRVNSDLVDYVYQGNTVFGAAFAITLMSDTDQFPRAQVSINNIENESIDDTGRTVGEAIRSLTTSPRIDIQLFAASDFNEGNPRTPIGTPTIEYQALYLKLRNVKCDVNTMSADLVGNDLSTEPWPSIRSTKDRLPGLFR